VFAALTIPIAGGYLRAQPTDRLQAGDAQSHLKNYDEALRQYRLGIQTDPGRANVYRKHMVETLMRQGKKAEAAAVNREILASDPQDIDSREFIVSLRIGKEDCTQAINDLRALLVEA